MLGGLWRIRVEKRVHSVHAASFRYDALTHGQVSVRLIHTEDETDEGQMG